MDGAASILIGLLLSVVAVLLARESKDLLIGERAAPAIAESIRDAAEREPGVVGVEGILTSQLAPDQVIANVGLEFDDSLRTPEIERVIGSLESKLREKHPELFRILSGRILTSIREKSACWTSDQTEAAKKLP